MKKLFILVSFILLIDLNALLIGNGFVQNDLKILKELDLKSSYIADYEFQEFYKKFYKKYRSSYANKMKKANLFIPLIKQILKENDMPSAFLYLAMAESNFVLKARSYKEAIGIWQFIPRTAKIYNLEIDYYIDERMDVEKSTKAAVKYLKKLYKMFDKWYLASLAYNCGEARIIEAITRATLDIYCKDESKNCKSNKIITKYRRTIKNYQKKKVKFNKLYKVYKTVNKWNYKLDIGDLLVVQKGLERQYLPLESRNYIRKIISLALMNNSQYLLSDDNNHLLNIGISSPIAKVQVKGGILLKSIADVVGVDVKKITFLNSHIIRNITPPYDKKYNIFIPYSTVARFNTNIKNIKNDTFEEYIVKNGDYLGKIASFYGIRYGIIKKYNKLKSNRLKIGQNLIIPIAPGGYKKPKYYYVKRGDTLSGISIKFKVPLQRVLKDNPKKIAMINIGYKIVINFK